MAAKLAPVHEPGTRGSGIPHPVDVHVGARIRARRLYLGINQEGLAKALGLTFQQVQKYEGGANRVSASRLKAIADVLRVKVPYFFPPPIVAAEDAARRERLQAPEIIALVRLYDAFPDDTVREKFRGLVAAMADARAS